MSLFERLPEDRRHAALAAIRERLGPGEITAVEHLPGGSALGVYRFAVDGEGYVLRVEGTGAGPRDPRRHYACMKIAAEGGVAPPVVHADADQGLAILRLIRPVAGPMAGRLAGIAQLVRRLHDLPLFPAPAAPGAVSEWVMDALATSDLLPPAVRDEVGALHRAVLAAYPAPAVLVSSHNDLNPSNILFDGERPWLVDWEQAGAGDPYVDLASLLNWLGGGEAAETVFLEAYFGGPPTAEARARLWLMRQVTRLTYGAVLLAADGATAPRLPLSAAQWAEAPGLDAIRAEMNTLAVHAGRVRFGAAFLKDAIAASRTAAFAEAAGVLKAA